MERSTLCIEKINTVYREEQHWREITAKCVVVVRVILFYIRFVSTFVNEKMNMDKKHKYVQPKRKLLLSSALEFIKKYLQLSQYYNN